MTRVWPTCLLAIAMCLLFVASPVWAQDLTPAQMLQKGISAYNDLEFAKARQHLEAYLRTPNVSKDNKLKALRYLAVCYYNEGQKAQAASVWKQALALSPRVALPAGQAPSTKRYFSTIKPPTAPRSRPIRTRVPVRRPTPRVAVRPIKRPLPTPKPGFRHTASLIVLGTGVAAAVTAAVFGVMASGSANALASQTTPGSGNELQATQTQATVATALWIGSGAVAACGVTLLAIELATARPAKQAHLPTPTHTYTQLHLQP